MNKPEDADNLADNARIANLIESLNPEQIQNFQKMFNVMAEQAGVEVPEEKKAPAPRRIREPAKKPKTVVNEDFTVTRDGDLESQKRPVRSQGNQWVDTGEDGRDEKTKLTPKQMAAMEATMQTRDRPEPQEKKTVRCHVCNRDFDVDPSAIYGEYIRCDKCVRR